MFFCVVGAGFSGCIIARHLAEQGHRILLVEQRSHIGGNCHTYRDSKTGIMLHAYGPHVFHTDDYYVWNFINQFGKFRPYTQRTKAVAAGNVYSFPINLLTINQYYDKTMSPHEAEEFILKQARNNIKKPKNFEEQALKFVGEGLYKAFFEGYTWKQWGRDPRTLPASILKRLPVRFNYNDNYFRHSYQGIPEAGYTSLMKAIIGDYKHNINLLLNTSFEDVKGDEFDHVFYTGPIDSYFDYCLGRLGYRSLQFERIDYSGQDYQGTPVINYCDKSIPYTRITEHKHFAYWEESKFPNSIVYREYPKECRLGDIPYYPIRLSSEQELLRKYLALANNSKNISFLGRLGTYRYLDMDVTVKEALTACKTIDEALEKQNETGKWNLPAFLNNGT